MNILLMRLKAQHLVSQIFKKIDLIMKFWIARDLDGDLWLYNRELEKKFGGFVPTDDNCDIMAIDNDLFPEVTFENSPQMVEFKLIKEN